MFPEDTLVPFSLDSVQEHPRVFGCFSLCSVPLFLFLFVFKNVLPFCLRGVKEKEMYSTNVPEPLRFFFSIWKCHPLALFSESRSAPCWSGRADSGSMGFFLGGGWLIILNLFEAVNYASVVGELCVSSKDNRRGLYSDMFEKVIEHLLGRDPTNTRRREAAESAPCAPQALPSKLYVLPAAQLTAT